MGLPVSLRRVAVAAVALTLGLPASNSIGSVAPGTITSQGAWVTVATPRPGVVLQRKRILVSGYSGYRTVWRLSWALGNAHITLGADPLGWYRRSDSAFGGARIASLDGSGGFVAGINGDTFAGGWYCSPCYLHGLLVHNRDVKNFGTGGPAVGFLPGGEMQMGQPAAVPVKLLLPGRGTGSSATVGAWNSLTYPSGTTIRADQVAVYTSGSVPRPVPSGYIAVTVQTTAFSGMLTGLHGVRNPTGLGVNESAQAFRVAEPAAPPVIATVPIVGSPATYPDSFTVPPGSAALVARLGSSGGVPYAGTGLQALAGHVGDARGVRVTLDDQGWGAVNDVMDGKFQLVARGVAQTAYPGWSDSWPWTCMGPGHGCWRTALARTATRGWLLIMGQRGSGYGLTTPDWARVLQRLGAVDAMGFDSNSAAELYRTGGARLTNPDGGRVIPSTTVLRYN